MAAEKPIVSLQDAERVRKRIAVVGEKALELLATELERCTHETSFGRKSFVGVSETWVKKFKYIADQLRRDYRLDQDADEAPAPAVPADPLAGLKIVGKKEAG